MLQKRMRTFVRSVVLRQADVDLRSAGIQASALLQVGDRSSAGFHQLVRLDTEHVVPRARGRPHPVVLQQVRVHEHTQLSAVTKGRHATVGFGNLLPQAEPRLASQVGFNKGPVLGISDRDLAGNRQVVSSLLRISQRGKRARQCLVGVSEIEVDHAG